MKTNLVNVLFSDCQYLLSLTTVIVQQGCVTGTSSL